LKDMKLLRIALIIIALVLCAFIGSVYAKEEPALKIAVEFTDHAAAAYVAIENKLYEKEGLKVTTYESYATGMALSGALTRGHIDAAYMCLIPAINAYANGGVPLKVVAGTHLYGYGLVVNPDKIKTVKDLEAPGMRIACMQEGSAVDVLLHKTVEKYGINEKQVLMQTRRMSPEKAILAIRAKQIDAAFVPEHWATMTETYGFSMLLAAKDVWPGMIGSVLVVKDDLITKDPETVRSLIRATRGGTEWIKSHPGQSAGCVARYLSFENEKASLKDTIEAKDDLKVAPELLGRSMGRIEYGMSLDKAMVQEVINYMARLGYIKKTFRAEDILDLRFLK
jgi:NitT/TauT family transport system substrate-binding protein